MARKLKRRDSDLPGTAAAARGRPQFSEKEMRIARALVGVTPDLLARHIGVTPPEAESDWTHFQIASPARLHDALRAIVGWYRADGASAAEASAAVPDATDNASLIAEYLRLRAQWETSQARAITDALHGRAPLSHGLASTAPRVAASESASKVASPVRRALLVDDASDILITVGAFLASFGFEVARASNANEALAVLADGRATELLVTDYAMPGMTGKDLAVQAAERHPALSVLIISGHPDCDDLAELPRRVRLLAKPFRRAKLRETIRELVEQAQAGASHPTDA